MTVDPPTFSEWLWNELTKRNWNQVDLARQADITKQAVNNYLNKNRIPEQEAMIKIALALRLPIETLYRAAGILPSPPDWSSEREEWESAYDSLDPEDRGEMLEFVRLKIARKKKTSLKVDTSPLKPKPTGA